MQNEPCKKILQNIRKDTFLIMFVTMGSFHLDEIKLKRSEEMVSEAFLDPDCTTSHTLKGVSSLRSPSQPTFMCYFPYNETLSFREAGRRRILWLRRYYHPHWVRRLKFNKISLVYVSSSTSFPIPSYLAFRKGGGKYIPWLRSYHYIYS